MVILSARAKGTHRAEGTSLLPKAKHHIIAFQGVLEKHKRAQKNLGGNRGFSLSSISR